MRKRAKTVLITGASSGLGHATAVKFLSKRWNVVALARNLSKLEAALPAADHIMHLRTDIADREAVAKAVKNARERFGRIDALVNNAGYRMIGPFELFSDRQIRDHFDTAVFGHMNVIREVLPIMREQSCGVIVNITSESGRVGVPYNSVYEAAKFAIEGFSESIRYELMDYGIRIKIIEPGPMATSFSTCGELASPVKRGEIYPGYARLSEFSELATQGVPPDEVAHTVYRAATSTSTKLRYPRAARLLRLRRLLPDRVFQRVMMQMLT